MSEFKKSGQMYVEVHDGAVDVKDFLKKLQPEELVAIKILCDEELSAKMRRDENHPGIEI